MYRVVFLCGKMGLCQCLFCICPSLPFLFFGIASAVVCPLRFHISNDLVQSVLGRSYAFDYFFRVFLPDIGNGCLDRYSKGSASSFLGWYTNS